MIPASHTKRGQPVTHVKTLPGNPYDGHTPASVIPDMEALVGNTKARILGGTRDTVATARRLKVFISGQKRRMMPKVNRGRPAVESHRPPSKAQHRHGAATTFGPSRAPAANAVLAAAAIFPFPLHPLAHYFVAPYLRRSEPCRPATSVVAAQPGPKPRTRIT
jgi:hypothetical protein